MEQKDVKKEQTIAENKGFVLKSEPILKVIWDLIDDCQTIYKSMSVNLYACTADEVLAFVMLLSLCRSTVKGDNLIRAGGVSRLNSSTITSQRSLITANQREAMMSISIDSFSYNYFIVTDRSPRDEIIQDHWSVCNTTTGHKWSITAHPEQTA